MLAAAGVTAPLPAFDLGAGPVASFTNPFSPEVLATLCGAGLDGQAVDCKGGFPIRVSVRVAQGTETQRGTTVIRLPVTAGAVSNANPVPGALTVDLPSGTQPLDDAGSVQVPRLKDSLLRVAIDDGQAQAYTDTDASGGDDHVARDAAFQLVRRARRPRQPPDAVHRRRRHAGRRGRRQMEAAGHARRRPADLAPVRRRARRSRRRRLDQRHRLAGVDAMTRAARSS